MQTVLDELKAAHVDAEGTTSPEAAPDNYDARDFDFIALGRGLLGQAGEALKARFRERHPAVQFVDTYAPFAAHQIIEVMNTRPGPVVDLDAYSRRIGYSGPLHPDLDTLRHLHERHPDAIPFEAIDVLLDRGISIQPDAVDNKLIHAGRGGYCFEHNNLFKRVLETVGFHVEGLSARVRWNAAPGMLPTPHTHMALRVFVDHEPWLVDVGFGGNVLTAPLRMDTTEPQPTQHETFRLVPFGPGLLLQVWMDDQWRPVYELSGEPRVHSDYEMANWYTSTHPGSHFRKNLMVARTTPEARYTLLNGRFSAHLANGDSRRETLDARGIETTLRETFRLPVSPDWHAVIERAAALTEDAR
ncbi:arylamine N-acetyltransferase family protein [Marinobacter halodurans]|nr:arylamine N-acetyltransferase [Marinobacter halodurans]